MIVYFFLSLGDAIKLRKMTYIKFDFIKTHFHMHSNFRLNIKS